MIIDPKTLRNHLAACSAGRYRLDALALTPDGILSTDGRCLLLSRYPTVDPEEAPKIDGINAQSPVPEELVLVSVDDAKKAAAMVGRTKAGDPVFAGLIQVECEDDKIKFGTGAPGASQAMTCKAAVGQYPPVGAVIPDYSNSTVVSVEIDVLLKSLKALKGATDKKYVAIRVVDGDTAIGFSCADGSAMLVMPISVDEDEDYIPDALAQLRSDQGRVRELPNSEPDTTPEPDQELQEELEPRLEEVASNTVVAPASPSSEPEPELEPELEEVEPAPVFSPIPSQVEMETVPPMPQQHSVESNVGKTYQPSAELAAILGG